MDADECIQIDMAEDIRILFGKDLTVRPFDYWKVRRTLYGGNRRRTCTCLLAHHQAP
jgi:hypothetical protein